MGVNGTKGGVLWEYVEKVTDENQYFVFFLAVTWRILNFYGGEKKSAGNGEK